MRATTNDQTGRRSFLKAMGVTGAVVATAGAGLMKPVKSLAAKWSFPKEAFNVEGSMEEAFQAALGTTNVKEGNVSLQTPTIAENGAVVPITATSDMGNKVSTFHVFVEGNPAPYTARFHLTDATSDTAEVSTRIKMGETSNVMAVAETTDGEFYKASNEVRVTIGGCGG
ncbi:thiosulfate oxidation carrier protein SoxY [Thiohalorhabdus sp.]|uniref:thiosulfate oxidation carrier protein SoxY n=1 Tax=Thiohalorhabdus sp. TaxID=3094134 RepID=UPI002FC3A56E